MEDRVCRGVDGRIELERLAIAHETAREASFLFDPEVLADRVPHLGSRFLVCRAALLFIEHVRQFRRGVQSGPYGRRGERERAETLLPHVEARHWKMGP